MEKNNRTQSLIRKYINDPEAKAFIEKHRRELPVLGYEEDDLAFFKSQHFHVYDNMIACDYIHLLQNKQEQELLYDFFYENLDYNILIMKYDKIFSRYKKKEFVIYRLKQKVITAYNKSIRQSLASTQKFVNKNYVKKNALMSISLEYRKKGARLYLFKVPANLVIKYSKDFEDEDIVSLTQKAQLIRKFTTKNEDKILERFLEKAKDGDISSLHLLNSVWDVLGQYRWVNANGFLINSSIDLVISELNMNDRIKIFDT